MTDIEHPRFARLYPLAADRADRRGAEDHRRRLLEGLTGRVVEVGAGDGRNFAHYPPAVSEVIAVEPEPTLRAAAAKAASERVKVLAGTADELPLEDASVDAGVVSLVLCSVPDQRTALAELRRVIRPGGELRFYEHVIAERHPKRALLQLLDRSGIWPKFAAGCHPARDTAAAIAAAGFTIEQCDRFGFRGGTFEPTIPYLLGRARLGA
jgi:ubiquinone/menaquinone biosynthesis C-methylase UbiE